MLAGAHTAAAGPEAASSELHITPLSAHVLTQLSLHGAPLIAPCLPPPASALEGLRASDPCSPELAASERAASELLALVPLLASAARQFRHELPVEEFLFFVPTPNGQTTAQLLADYVAYSQQLDDDRPGDEDEQEGDVCCLALRAIRALSAFVARPVGRTMLAGLSMANVVPQGGPAQAAVAALFRPEAAPCRPRRLLAAVELLEAAARDSLELLDCLLFPAALEGSAQEPAAAQPPATTALAHGAAGATGSAAGGGAIVTTSEEATANAAAAAAAAPKKKSASAAAAVEVWSVLDGLSSLLERAADLGALQRPEVLCHVMRAVCALWQRQPVTARPVQLLRQGPAVWEAIKSVLEGSGSGGGGGGVDGAWAQLTRAYCWQILMLEAHATKRQPAGDAAAASAPLTAWALLDRLVERGGLAAEIRRCGWMEADGAALRRLGLLLQACYLELGACCLGGIIADGGGAAAVAGEDPLPVSGLVKEVRR